MRAFSLLLSLLAATLCGTLAAAQEASTLEAEHGSLAWYLPADVEYDSAFPKPADVLGWEVGEWHVRHDQLVRWFEVVAEKSPRVQLQEYARSHEQRPLMLAAVSSPENLANLEQLRQQRVDAIRTGESMMPGINVVWMGYSVHGNESSGSNAALLLAYYLAAATGEDIERYLERTIVLIDPCLNPDGLSRFAQWANMHKGQILVADGNHREHTEGFPSGRTNHYWFDLNRDWLLLTHPESQGRVEQFQRWLPTVLTDYHEMGTDSSYFFQPGIPSRRNPLTPERNHELTAAIARFHAEALDEIGSLYFTEESFDDFYYGKGSTYPDLHGGVGILFEQASSRGHLQESSYGRISFPFTIRNQFVTSLSTLRAADELRGQLSDWQLEFYRMARDEAKTLPVKGYVFGDPQDFERSWRMASILHTHGIEVHALADDLEVEDLSFRAKWSFVVPMEQAQARLVRALFETRTSWDDNTFYDVSSWNLPLSFNMPCVGLDESGWQRVRTTQALTVDRRAGEQIEAVARPVAYLFEWHDAYAPAALQRLLSEGVLARVATKPFRCETAGGAHDFDYGTIVVARGTQALELDELKELMRKVAGAGIYVHAATGGLTPEGVDLGSRSILPLEKPELAVIVEGGASTYEAGEVWHELDTRIGLPTTLLERDRLTRVDLDRYSHLVFVNGAASGLSGSATEALRDWVRGGGTLIATKSSAVWAAQNLLGGGGHEGRDSTPRENPEESPEGGAVIEEQVAYVDYEQKRAEQNVAGTIFEAEYDRTHPLLFGYTGRRLPVFRNSTRILDAGDNPFATPLRYTDAPLLSGFASAENVAKIAGSAVLRAERLGGGTVVCMIDNPVFRGVWWGTRRLLTNAIYFGPTVKRTAALDEADDEDDAAESHGHKHE